MTLAEQILVDLIDFNGHHDTNRCIHCGGLDWNEPDCPYLAASNYTQHLTARTA